MRNAQGLMMLPKEPHQRAYPQASIEGKAAPKPGGLVRGRELPEARVRSEISQH